MNLLKLTALTFTVLYLLSDGYTVCDGIRLRSENGTSLTYKYFLCPEDINQPFKRYCCSDVNGMGVCCSYDQKSSNIVGTVAGVIIFLVLSGLLFYCCCYRKRTSRKFPDTTAAFVTPTPAAGIPRDGAFGQVNTGQTQASVPPYPGGYSAPYPTQPTQMPKDSGLPYPTAYPTSLYPQAPSTGVGGEAPQLPAVSSGWGAAHAGATTPPPGIPTSVYEGPPPPYSVAVASAPYPSN